MSDRIDVSLPTIRSTSAGTFPHWFTNASAEVMGPAGYARFAALVSFYERDYEAGIVSLEGQPVVLANVEGAIYAFSGVCSQHLFPAMAQARCRTVMFGIESGSQKVLDRLKKEQTLEEVETAVHNAKRAGIEIVELQMPELKALNDKISFPVALYEANVDLAKYLKKYGLPLDVKQVAAKIASPDVKGVFDGMVVPGAPKAIGSVPSRAWAPKVGATWMPLAEVATMPIKPASTAINA